MKTSVRKSQDLPSYCMDLPELQLFVQRMLELHPSNASFQAELKAENRSITIDHPRELSAIDDSVPRYQTFTIRASSDQGSTGIYTFGGMSKSILSIEGNDGAWVAGASEVLREQITKYPTWYRPLWSPIWFRILATSMFLLIILPVLSKYLGPTFAKFWAVIFGGIVVLTLAFATLRPKLIPHAYIEIKHKSSFLLKHGTTLTIIAGVVVAIMALASFVLTLYQTIKGTGM